MNVFCPHPTILSDLPDVWWDVADPHNRTLNAGKFSAILDKSGNNVNAVQAAANDQPPFVAAGQDNVGTLKGDGVSDYMTMDIPLPAAFTFFVVADREEAYPLAYVLGGDDNVGASPAILQNFNPGSGVAAYEIYYLENGTAFRQTFSEDATGYNVLAMSHDDNADSPKTVGYFNGVEVFSGDSKSFVGRKFNYLLSNFVLLDYSTCNFCSFAMYHRVLEPHKITSLSKSFFLSRRGRP